MGVIEFRQKRVRPRSCSLEVSAMDRTLVSQSWDAEYRKGRYIDEPPLLFAGEILATCVRNRLDQTPWDFTSAAETDGTTSQSGASLSSLRCVPLRSQGHRRFSRQCRRAAYHSENPCAVRQCRAPSIGLVNKAVNHCFSYGASRTIAP